MQLNPKEEEYPDKPNARRLSKVGRLGLELGAIGLFIGAAMTLKDLLEDASGGTWRLMVTFALVATAVWLWCLSVHSPLISSLIATVVRKTRTMARVGMVGIPVAGLLVGVATLYWMRTTRDIDENFAKYDGTYESLKQLNLQVLNLDIKHWSNGGPGHLIIDTQQGDFWLKVTERLAVVRNFVVHPIRDATGYEITAALQDFNPSSNWQQAGIIFYEDDDNYVRLTEGYNDYAIPEPEIGLQYVVEESGIPRDGGMVLKMYDSHPIDRVWLQITKEGNAYTLRYRIGADWWGYKDFAIVHSRINPRYVGLAAFQGGTQPIDPHDTSKLKQLNQPPAAADFVRFIVRTRTREEPK